MSETTIVPAAARPAPRLARAEPPIVPRATAATDAACLEIRSEALLGDGREVLIHHRGEVYRLRHTRNDKLILTK